MFVFLTLRCRSKLDLKPRRMWVRQLRRRETSPQLSHLYCTLVRHLHSVPTLLSRPQQVTESFPRAYQVQVQVPSVFPPTNRTWLVVVVANAVAAAAEDAVPTQQRNERRSNAETNATEQLRKRHFPYC